MKKGGHMARLSHFVILGLFILPVVVFARNNGYKMLRLPENKELGNSQTMELLSSFININPTSIGGGSIAIIDETALSTADDGAFIESATGAISVYVVREGDTLSAIADMFGVSTNTIIWANDLKSRTLKVGDELIILPISGVRHTVKSGDTLESLAKKYKADLDEIISYNNFSAGAKLGVGDVVIIPDGTVSITQTAVKPTSTTVSAGYYMRPISGGRKSQGLHGYNGIDLAASVGTPVMASAGGKVIIARPSGYNGGYGLYVVISHSNGTQTLYAHLSRVNVSVGNTVNKGEVIGAVGNTGRSTGPHLHFEVRGAKNPF